LPQGSNGFKFIFSDYEIEIMKPTIIKEEMGREYGESIDIRRIVISFLKKKGC
jgi:hypothetical protein